MYGNKDGNSCDYLRAVAGLIGSLTFRSPIQALRVSFSFAFQGISAQAREITIADLARDVRALEHVELRRAVSRVLAEFHQDDYVSDVTRRAYNQGLVRCWRDSFGSDPPCSSSWRNLRLVIADLNGEHLADLCRRLGTGYHATYSRQRRALSADWREELGVLASLPDIVVSVIGNRQNAEHNENAPDRLLSLKPYAAGDHDRTDKEDVRQPDRLRFQLQQLEDGLSAHAEQGFAGFVLTPAPGRCPSK